MMTLASPLFLDLTQPADGLRGRAADARLGGLRVGCAPTSSPAAISRARSCSIGPLAKKFGVSAVAVREALSRLVADGLVVVEDQRGFRVSPLSLSDLRDVTHTRIELECLALRRSIARGDAAWRAALERRGGISMRRRISRRATTTAITSSGRACMAASTRRWCRRAASTGCCASGRILFEQSERYRRLSLAVMRSRAATRAASTCAIYEAAMRATPTLRAAERCRTISSARAR